jgi:two-component system, response regulator PdtaR
MMLAESSRVPVRLWLAAGPGPDGGDQPEHLQAGTKSAARALRVLIVEDEFYIALDIEETLTALGHSSVGIAASAAQAIGIAERERPDVILMDVRLAGKRDGIDAAGEIMSHLGIRSIFVTANTDPHTRERAAAVNPAGFLEKPLTPQRLQAVLDALSSQT